MTSINNMTITKSTADSVVFGLELGVWIELGLLTYVHMTFAYIVRRMTDYVLKSTAFEHGRCQPGFSLQEVPTAYGSTFTGISGLGWTL